MEMVQGGLIDTNVAMQLLGDGKSNAAPASNASSAAPAAGNDTNPGDNPSSSECKKRPIDEVDTPKESLDDILEQAKRAKNDPGKYKLKWVLLNSSFQCLLC